MSALGDVIPHKNVAVQTVGVAVGLSTGVADPVVVIGSPHLVGITVLQRPADADDKDGWIFLKNDCLAALARQVGIHREQLLCVQKREFFGQVWVARVVQFGEHFLSELLGVDEDFPDLADD